MRRLVSWLDDIDSRFATTDEPWVVQVRIAVVVTAAVGGVLLGVVTANALR